jgi:hypothetical protein
MLFSFTPVIFGNFATASTVAANFLPNVSYPNYFDTANELQRSINVANYISSLLVSRYGSGYVTTGISTTAQKVNYQASLSNLQNYDKIVFFSKGHRTWHAGQIGIIPYHTMPYPDVNSYLVSSEIYSRTSSKNVVTFMWHCETARYYPGSGLPYSFTHDNNMGYYGGTGNQVYLGWEERWNFHIQWPNGTITPPNPNYPTGSPQYEWKMTANNDFGRVAELYWYYMYAGYSSDYALNQATQAIYGVNFSSSYINSWLVIWGNKYLPLP